MVELRGFYNIYGRYFGGGVMGRGELEVNVSIPLPTNMTKLCH